MMKKDPALDSEIPLVPKSAPAKLQPVFYGSSGETCSVKCFSDFLPDSWGSEENTSSEKLTYNLKTFRSQPPFNSIQRRIHIFLNSLEKFRPNYWGMVSLVQFWASITANDGRRILTVSQQPFATRQYLKGLCRYRYYCLQLCRIGKYFGPVGRAFNRGSLEFSPHVDIFSDEDFPLKNHAKHCGVAGYLALPVFELGNGDIDGQQQSCVGVLEFISLTKNILSSCDTKLCMTKLKEVGLAFRYPSHSRALTQIRPYFNFPSPGNLCKGAPDEISSVLDVVRKAYSLPLIQVWLPCICNGSEVSIACELNNDSFYKITHLVCGLKCLDRDERWSAWLSSYVCSDSEVYFVENGKSWVGRAHSLRKICFVKDIRKYNIVDYPLLTLGHSSDLLACYAVPLQLVDPKLPPLILEVFLPTQYNFDVDRGAILKPLLSMVARELSKYNADFGLRQYEECLIEISHLDVDYDCPYDKTPAMAKPWLTYVRRKSNSVCHGLQIVEEVYVQHQQCQPNNATEIEELQVPTAENMGPYTVPNHKSLVFGHSTVKRKRRSSGTIRRPRQRTNIHPTQQIPELPIMSVDSSDEEGHSGIGYCPSDKSKKRGEEAAMISIPILFDVPITTNGRIESINPGNNEVVRGVSMPSTNGKGKITESENDEVDHGTSIPTNAEGRNTVPENDEVDHSCSMIVQARYKDDKVRFPFSSSSGIEGLHGDLLKRFELGAGRFKIKYPEGGDWIMLACSEDLSFHMHALASSGKTTLDLSVFSTT